MAELTTGQLTELARDIKARVDEYTYTQYESNHRDHLGASVIGHSCSRYVWFAFRWTKRAIFPARMLRLFNTGHVNEARLVEWLRGAGINIQNVDQVTGKQFEYSSAATLGHYGGSTDGLAVIDFNGKQYSFVIEFKTHNTQSYVNLVKNKLLIAKPKHYAQMCQYGKWFGAKYGLYVAQNKNDDDIYIEAVELNEAYAEDISKKAYDIIFSQNPPARIAMRPDYWECKHCTFIEQCFYGAQLEVNCRSCENARPVENERWRCAKFGDIPPEYVKDGCPQWSPIFRE